MTKQNLQTVRGYCAQCSSHCPTISYVRDGVFVEVKSDKDHPNACALCPKGLAGPELVYSKQRLQYPMMRTRPKGDPDPGWKRISWDEALDTIAGKLNEIKAKWGPEAVAFCRGGSGSSPMGELQPWLWRLAHAFGSPNTISTTHICQWHRDECSAYTYGKPPAGFGKAQADFENASVILIWGTNPQATSRIHVRDIKRGRDNGAKLIVVDTRRTPLAATADLWLQVQPGTDGALALSMINVMIGEKLFDYNFVRDWTTGPFLVRQDNGNFLRANDLINGADPASFVFLESVTNAPRLYLPGTVMPTEAALDAALRVRLATGGEIECKTAFRLLRERAAEYAPKSVENLTGIPGVKIRDAAIMFASKPSCYYSFNGIEQSTNASQTNRAICILYSLTGNHDAAGGNVSFPVPPLNRVQGNPFLSDEVKKKRLGLAKRPLGPAETGSVQAYEAYHAMLTGKPYPIKALVGMGGNLVTSNAPSLVARDALAKLDFQVDCELFLTPTAEMADIVLPSSSFWESWHAGADFRAVGTTTHIQLRPAVVPPQNESWPDIKIIFELAKRLGVGGKFWDGDIEAGFNHFLAPTGITVDQLKATPGGITIDSAIEHKKYSKKGESGKSPGFNTASKRIEIYSQLFKDRGYDPLPVWKEPITVRFAKSGQAKEYPFILITAKILQYCHSQHRALPSLRKAAPYPFLEIHPQNARQLGCDTGDWLLLETPCAAIRVQAKVTDVVPLDIVCTQNGWWQGCDELGLPGFDPYSPRGANVNLLYPTDDIDPISGSLPLKAYPCKLKKA